MPRTHRPGGRLRAFATILALVITSGMASTGLASAHGLAGGITKASGDITVTVTPDGSWTVQTQAPLPSWTFSGTTGYPVTNIANSNGSDRLGAYQEVDFTYLGASSRRSGIRSYTDTPVVLFSTTYLTAGANTEAFPIVRTYPRLANHLSYQDADFSPYQFNGANAPDSPLLSFDSKGNSYLLSAADGFQLADTTMDKSGTITAGIIPGVAQLPAGFTHNTVLAFGNSINATYDTWGHALLARSGKASTPGDADVTLDKLGYWTDNGAAYYYSFDAAKGYEGTLQAVIQDFAAKGLPLGYLQLDSWFYPKGSSESWQGNGTNRGGEYVYRAAPDLFPDGLATFQQRIGVPLVTHARWIDTASPYRQQYTISGNVSTDPQFWDDTMRYLKSAGVATYEQDWLSQAAQPVYNLTDPDAYLGGMAAAATMNGLTMQYCMPLPRDYLQSTLYPSLTTTRVSVDRFEPTKWDDFLYDSRLASALGERPWSDVFMSTETNNLILATLSSGVVGVGDPIDKEDVANLAKVVRADGVIVKPDAPVIPTGGTYLAEAAGSKPAMIASTYTQHGPLRDVYVFAYARNGQPTQPIAFRPSSFNITGTAYVYNYFTGTGQVVPSGATFTDTVGSGSYYLVVPIDASGVGFLGDAGKFVSLGDKRISQLSDDGSLHATVVFASGEQQVTLHGYASAPPLVHASDGVVGPVTYDAANHLFSVNLRPGTDNSGSITVSQSKGGR